MDQTMDGVGKEGFFFFLPPNSSNENGYSMDEFENGPPFAHSVDGRYAEWYTSPERCPGTLGWRYPPSLGRGLCRRDPTIFSTHRRTCAAGCVCSPHARLSGGSEGSSSSKNSSSSASVSCAPNTGRRRRSRSRAASSPLRTIHSMDDCAILCSASSDSFHPSIVWSIH